MNKTTEKGGEGEEGGGRGGGRVRTCISVFCQLHKEDEREEVEVKDGGEQKKENNKKKTEEKKRKKKNEKIKKMVD